MAGPIDPFDPTRPQLPDNAGELTATIRAIKEVLVDYKGRIETLEAQVAANLGATTGTIVSYGGSLGSIPAGFLYCNGAEISREDNATLFAVIGVTWGAGNGTTTFNLPDLRGRSTRGVDDGAARDHELSRVIGSYQDDKLQNFEGSFKVYGGSGINNPLQDGTGIVKDSFPQAEARSYTFRARTNTSYLFRVDIDAASMATLRTADETTVKNGAVAFIIKT